MENSFVSDDVNNMGTEQDVFLPDVDKLLEIFPVKLTNHFKHVVMEDVIELIMEVGRLPEIRHAGGRIDLLGNIPVLFRDIAYICEKFPEIQKRNFIEIPGTLHRLKVTRDFQSKISGITCSIGRFVTDSIDCINDIITNGQSILLVGRHKSGKTTKLREAAILYSSQLGKNVVVIDPYKDILGEDDTLHPTLKNVKRYVGAEGQFKKELLLEADEIFKPVVIIIDELTTRAEVHTVYTLVKKGKIVIASILGTTLEALIKNPTLFDTIGGIQSVNFSEKEENENVDKIEKPVFKRAHKAIFKTLIEVLNVNTFSVYEDTEKAVDSILNQEPIEPEIRGLERNNLQDDRYKNSNFDDDGKKDVRVKSMKAIIQESFFHGASWMGQNFIA